MISKEAKFCGQCFIARRNHSALTRSDVLGRGETEHGRFAKPAHGATPVRCTVSFCSILKEDDFSVIRKLVKLGHIGWLAAVVNGQDRLCAFGQPSGYVLRI